MLGAHTHGRDAGLPSPSTLGNVYQNLKQALRKTSTSQLSEVFEGLLSVGGHQHPTEDRSDLSHLKLFGLPVRHFDKGFNYMLLTITGQF